jgi:hypothetical protein
VSPISVTVTCRAPRPPIHKLPPFDCCVTQVLEWERDRLAAMPRPAAVLPRPAAAQPRHDQDEEGRGWEDRQEEMQYQDRGQGRVRYERGGQQRYGNGRGGRGGGSRGRGRGGGNRGYSAQRQWGEREQHAGGRR